MTETKPEYPGAEAGDPDEVVLALETGRALWSKGDLRDAVRWLRRAAEKAVRVGHNARGAFLARAAAELSTHLTVPPTPPPLPVSRPITNLDSDFTDTTIVDRPPISGVAGMVQRAVSSSRARSRQGLRVAVQPSLEEPDVLLIKVLEEDQAPPPGSHEDMLVALEPGVDLRALRK